ncbi:aminoglycoside adenylyltransferase domain-containing protein [Corynebacterium kalidii]|uniref:DUF4111 domain-containing protein n=1 Tax=Corynebacterium kalidii TaxID=2931982 RepID=A0A9X1WJ81_9CORY|nr:aminoglycoside adenylyltransferase domain-containing protein [Corynebacterium kalidii]MCJ7859208.1 DUF4111 domain-containing protein [Corynebacterium kalidii]
MDDVIRTFLDRVLVHDPGGIVGVYLYGSSTTSRLAPESDVDLLLVTDRSMQTDERASLLSEVLALSGWVGHSGTFPEVAHRRPLEVTSLVAADLHPLAAAPRRDFQFGEWLRGAVVQGYVPEPEWDPDVVILLATALASHRVLHGPPLEDMVEAIPVAQLRQAQRSVLPALLEELDQDPRNVLLTLARAVHTVETGEIVAKDAAVAAVAGRLDPAGAGMPGAEMLRAAAREYRDGAVSNCEREPAQLRELARTLAAMVR